MKGTGEVYRVKSDQTDWWDWTITTRYMTHFGRYSERSEEVAAKKMREAAETIGVVLEGE